MQDATEQRLARLHERLQSSREDIFVLAHALKDGQPVRPPRATAHVFPRSRIMRAITGRRGRMLLGGAAVALSLLRPQLAVALSLVRPQLWRGLRWGATLRPLVLRYLLPRLLTAPPRDLL